MNLDSAGSSRREQVLDALGRQIVHGAWAPGTTLPRELDLAATYAVSRAVIREVLRELAARGLVAARPKLGTVVRPHAEWQLWNPRVLGWRLGREPIDAALAQVIEVRRLIEPAIAALAAERATPDERDALAASFAAMEAAVARSDVAAFLDADTAFHAALLNGCQNPMLAQLGQLAHAALASNRTLTVRAAQLAQRVDPTALERKAAEALRLHGAVLLAVQRADPTAARLAMEQMIARAEATLARLDQQLASGIDAALLG
jgi:DNA-binding FadR family transcriptional regulator